MGGNEGRGEGRFGWEGLSVRGGFGWEVGGVVGLVGGIIKLVIGTLFTKYGNPTPRRLVLGL